MGQQVQLYLTPSDALEIQSKVLRPVHARFLASRSNTGPISQQESVIIIEEGVPRLDCFVTSSLFQSLKARRSDPQNCWFLDGMLSDVVEMRGCHFKDGTLRRGRLFFDLGYYEGGNWKPKSDEFIQWANNLFLAFKEHLEFDRHLQALVGRDARDWNAKGGEFLA
jgi:hypothetical protein